MTEKTHILDTSNDPFALFRIWFDEASKKEINDSNAMNLCTISKDLKPSSRMVLLKSFNSEGFVFYTNTNSKKGQSIINNPESAIDTMAREELGLNPNDLGSPIIASITSILSFTLGAIVPIIPFMLTSGTLALILTSLLSIFFLMIIGGITALNTGVNLLKGSMRMLFFGSAAALITYISGTLIGVGLS